MKLTSRLLAAGISIAFAAAPAHAVLLGHWKFDDGSGTTAIDSSGNGYDATQGAAAGGWIAGKASGAYNLPRFKLGAADSIAVKNGGGTTVTLSVWMTVSSVTNNFQGIAGFESTGNGQDVFSLKMDNTDKIVWTVDGSSSFASADTLTNYAAATGDGWVHVVGVYEQGVGSTLYVNGASAGTGAAANAIQTDTSTFGIGSYQGGGSWVFSGSIDDVQVYDQALTVGDVTFLNNNPGSVLGGGPATIAMGASSANTITDDGATVECQVLNDDADDVTLVWAFADQGDTTVGTWTAASGGGSHSFGAASQDDVLSQLLTGLDGDTTYSFRFFATAGGDSDWSNAGSFATGLGGSPAPADLAGTPDTTAVGTKVDLTWTDSYTNETGFLIQRSTDPGFGGTPDEFSVGADETSFTDDTTDPNTTYYYRIAAEGTSGNGPFSANFEVMTGDNPPTGLIGHWTFDDGAGTTAVDSSTNGFDADQGAAAGSWITGKTGGAYNLPRFNVDAAESEALNLAGGSAVTLSVWVTDRTGSNFEGIAGFESTGTGSDIYGFKMDSDDKINWTALPSHGPLPSSDTLANYAAATGDGWVHVVGVFEEGVGSTLYVNGAVAATGAAGSPLADKTPPSLFGIGSYQGGSAWAFTGSIDDVQVYNLAASAADVTFLYNNPGSVLGENTTFRLTITPNGANYDLTWDSQSSKVYDLVSSTDLTTPITSWPVYDDGVFVYENVDPSGTGSSTLIGVVGSGPKRFFAMIEKDPPPFYSEDFESGDGDFATVGSPNDWERGTPNADNSFGLVLTSGNNGSANCWGTILGTGGTAPFGVITAAADSILQGPDASGSGLDLTTMTTAELIFAAAVDAKAGDTIEVLVREVGTDTLLDTLTPITAPSSTDWSDYGPLDLATGIGKNIYLQFRFVGADGTYIGLYIDDIVVEAN